MIVALDHGRHAAETLDGASVQLPDRIDDRCVMGIDDVSALAAVSGEVKLPDAPWIDGLDVAVRVEAVVVAADVDIVDVEQNQAVGLVRYRRQELPFRHARLREADVARDVLEQNAPAEEVLDPPHPLGDVCDRLLGVRQRQQIVNAKPVGQYPWYLRPFFRNQGRKYGSVLDSALLWARSPSLFIGVAVLYGMIDRRSSPLCPALRSLVTVRVSQINDCPFCVDLNSATLLRHGVCFDKVDALQNWRNSPLYDDRERISLEYAEAMTFSGQQVGDELIGRLREHYDDDAIVELTALIAFQNLSSKFNSALSVPAQGFCGVPGNEKNP